MTHRRVAAATLAGVTGIATLAGVAYFVAQPDVPLFADGFESSHVGNWSESYNRSLLDLLRQLGYKQGSRTSWWKTSSTFGRGTWDTTTADLCARWGDVSCGRPYSFRSENSGPHSFYVTEIEHQVMPCLHLTADNFYVIEGRDLSYVDGASVAVERYACAMGCQLQFFPCPAPQPTPTEGP